MAGTVKIAVVGAGLVGRRHAALVHEEVGCTLTGIVDPDASASAFAADKGVPHFSTIDDLMRVARPDAAIVAAPNALHEPIGSYCATHNIHLLVEKPIAHTVSAARALVEAAHRAGMQLLVGHHRRYHPSIEVTREVIQGGRIGRLLGVSGLWGVRKPDDYFEVEWRRRKGGGPILINLNHDIDTLRYVCGEIAEVSATGARTERQFEVEDTVAVTLRFANGALGSLVASDAAATPWGFETATGENPHVPRTGESCYRFLGSEGAFDFPSLALWRHVGGGPGDWTRPMAAETLAAQSVEPLRAQLQHFLRVLHGEEEPRVTGEDAIRTLEATLAVSRAAEQSETVPL